jgi:ketosteroid isomerase-like protein
MRNYRNIFCTCIILLFFAGCVTSEKQVKPESPDEIAIRELVQSFEEAWNAGDKDKYLSFWHEQGKIKVGRSREVMSKTEYAKLLPDRMLINPLTLSNPKIKVDGDKATAKMNLNTKGHSFQYSLNLVRQNGQWLVMENIY